MPGRHGRPPVIPELRRKSQLIPIASGLARMVASENYGFNWKTSLKEEWERNWKRLSVSPTGFHMHMHTCGHSYRLLHAHAHMWTFLHTVNIMINNFSLCLITKSPFYYWKYFAYRLGALFSFNFMNFRCHSFYYLRDDVQFIQVIISNNYTFPYFPFLWQLPQNLFIFCNVNILFKIRFS